MAEYVVRFELPTKGGHTVRCESEPIERRVRAEIFAGECPGQSIEILEVEG